MADSSGLVLARVRSLADLVDGFFEEDAHAQEPLSSFEDDDEQLSIDHEVGQSENKAFWEAQQQLLKDALSITTGLEARIARRIESARAECSCSRGLDCRSCRLQAIAQRLRESGYDCALCKSKWRSSTGIPSGEHTYLDVVHRPSNGKRGPVRILIELSFRAEFEVARANGEYDALVRLLPQVFVGRPEKLRTIIKVMCTAAKKCIKDSGLHVGPWRKHKYMQAKWLSDPAERVARDVVVAEPLGLGGGFTEERRRSPRSRASMLTTDLLEKLPAAMHYTAVKVQ